MADTKKNGFHTVEVDMEEYEQKLRAHRKKIFKRIMTLVIAVDRKSTRLNSSHTS